MYSSGTLGINVEVTKPISGRLRAAARNLFTIIAKKLDIFSGAIFQDELKSAGRADTGNRRRRKTENGSDRQPAEFLVQSILYFLILFRSALRSPKVST